MVRPLYLGFSWTQNPPIVTKITNLHLLKERWIRSVFHWCNHLATLFVSSIGLDVIIHMDTLTKSTQQALKDSWQGLSLLNTEISLKRKAVLQNEMALTLLTPHQGAPVPLS